MVVTEHKIAHVSFTVSKSAPPPELPPAPPPIVPEEWKLPLIVLGLGAAAAVGIGLATRKK